MIRASSTFTQRLCHHQNLYRQLRNFKRLASTQKNTGSADYSSSANAVDSRKDAKEDVTISTNKLAPRAPLVKNFFMGRVDKELLAFPEVVKREELATLNNEVIPLQNFFDSEKFQDASEGELLTPEVLEQVRGLGLYGINVPVKYHGKGLNWSESLLVTLPESTCTDLSLGLLSHRAIIDLLDERGSALQKEQFLSQLGEGTLIGTEAVFEYNAPEDGFFNTKAEYNMESQKWTLSGEKAFVVSMPLMKDARYLYLVIAETQRLNVKGDNARATTIFLVDSTLPGVRAAEQHETFGCRGVPMRRVQFDCVEMTEACIIGQAHDGNKYADALLRANRLRGSVLGLGLAKSLLNELAEHCVNTKQCGAGLTDMEAIKTHVSKLLCSSYAIESMLFYTTGLLDEFNKPDVELEAAIIKYYTLNELMALTTRSMDVIGPKTLHRGRLTERVFRNSAQLYTQGETMDTLRFFIALSGLQYAGALMNDSVRMTRNPLFHPGHFFGKMLQSTNIESPKTKMRLGENLHPALEAPGLAIEQSVARLHMCVDLLFSRFGNEIVQRHNEMRRLADMATHIFAMFASASRASRSYCIGLQFADHEMLLAAAICNHGRDTIKTLTAEIFDGEYLNNDRNLKRLSTQIFKSKGYFPVQPLTYNF